MAANLVLRLGWAVYVSPDQKIVQQHVVLLLGVAEVVRRFMWAALRVENESLKHERADPALHHLHSWGGTHGVRLV